MRRSWIALLLLTACFDPAATSPEDGSTGDATETGESTMSTSGPGSMSDPGTMSGMTEDESSGPGPVGCADGQGVCVAVPSGWSGPVAAALAGGVTDPDCAGAEASIVAHGDIAGTDASCECECEAATGAGCPDGRLVAYSDNACAEDEVFSQIVHADNGGDPCNFMPSGDAVGEVPVEDASHWGLITTSVGGSCEPTATPNLPTAAFETSIAGCAVAEIDGMCGGDATCWESPAPPFEAGVCVWRLGEQECPTGFGSRTVWYRGELEDSRACSECTCGEAMGSCPTSAFDIYEGYYCNDPVISSEKGVCTEICFGDMCNTYAVSALFFPGPAEATCAPVGGELTGELTAADPVTFCCTN